MPSFPVPTIKIELDAYFPAGIIRPIFRETSTRSFFAKLRSLNTHTFGLMNNFTTGSSLQETPSRSAINLIFVVQSVDVPNYLINFCGGNPFHLWKVIFRILIPYTLSHVRSRHE